MLCVIVVTLAGAAGGCWGASSLCGSTGLSWASCEAVTLLVVRVPVFWPPTLPGCRDKED